MTQSNDSNHIISQNSGHKRAIVIGGGVSGLLTSRVLSNHFDEVVMLERDQYPQQPELRAGVPQARHVHLLLIGGKQILEELFPGISQELMDHGAISVKMGDELGVLTYFGWRIKYPGGLDLVTFTQPLLEWCLRNRLKNLTSVHTKEGCRVSGLIAGNDNQSVEGVRYHLADDPGKKQSLYGHFIVDASGRFSHTPKWISGLGYKPPEETIVDSSLGYATRMFEAPEINGDSPLHHQHWKALLLMGKPPGHTRGGVLLPVEGNRWHVTLVGVEKDYPPNDEQGFLEFSKTLRSPLIYNSIKDARPLTPVSSYRSTENRRRHYEKLPQWPENFVVMGDALCAFNPVYGQGISLAAMEAKTLDNYLNKHNKSQENGMARKLQTKLVRTVETPWLMATYDDSRWPNTTGTPNGLFTRFMHRYLDGVITVATKSPKTDRLFARVAHLLNSPYVLFRPQTAIRVLAHWLNPLTKNGEDVHHG